MPRSSKTCAASANPENGSTGTSKAGTSLTESLLSLTVIDRDALTAMWPSVMGCPARRNMSQGLMRQFLAYEMQAADAGGLNRAEIDQLDRLASGATRRPSARLAPGARFLREWNGVTHVVERRENGYLWNGETFASLSAIAKKITGAHWSGPRFFGLKAAASAHGKSGSTTAKPSGGSKAP